MEYDFELFIIVPLQGDVVVDWWRGLLRLVLLHSGRVEQELSLMGNFELQYLAKLLFGYSIHGDASVLHGRTSFRNKDFKGAAGLYPLTK